jgi:asparagine synthase (glutamine-hydrolysing)
LKLRGFTTKWILREAIRDVLPPAILSRPKMGFPVPFGNWMRGGHAAVARDVLLDRRTRERGIIEPRAVERLLDGHAAGSANGGDAIWSLLNLELWYRTFVDRHGIQALPRANSSEARTGNDALFGAGMAAGLHDAPARADLRR